MKKQIAPSILSSNFQNLGDEIIAVEKAGADMIHIDVMDGAFVPNITFGPPVIKSVRSVTKLPFDVHLMIDEPSRYLKDFADAGADIITVHVEACRHLDRTIHAIKDLGKQAGVALNPATPLFALDHLLELVDLVLVMTVNPGFGGQSFIEGSIQKIRVLKKKIERFGYDLPIEVDGGISAENIARVSDAGADIFVAGSAIFKTGNYKETIDGMRSALAD